MYSVLLYLLQLRGRASRGRRGRVGRGAAQRPAVQEGLRLHAEQRGLRRGRHPRVHRGGRGIVEGGHRGLLQFEKLQ